jgi:hypothetical protein
MIEWAVSEAEQAAKMGLVTAMLPSFMDDRAYNLPEWDRSWAALQDMNIVASMHLCGREPYGIAHGPGAGGINVGVIKFGMYDTVMRLIWGGAPMRFQRPSFGWSHAEAAAIDIGHCFQPNQIGRFRSENAWTMWHQSLRPHQRRVRRFTPRGAGSDGAYHRLGGWR